MEYIKGGTLADYIASEIRLPLELALNLQKDICSGLAKLHSSTPPLVHRDVKPQNIMLSVEADKIVAKVSDFGQAKHVDPVTRIIEAAGTLAYLPPEGFWDYETSASDVFSAGIMFYMMLTGVSPYKMPSDYQSTKKGSLKSSIQASRNKHPEPPSKFNADIEHEIDNIVLTALEPDMRKRYANAGEFFAAIEQYETKTFQILDDNIKKALQFGKQYSTLSRAIELLEDSIAKQPRERKQKMLKQYTETIRNWKKGVIM